MKNLNVKMYYEIFKWHNVLLNILTACLMCYEKFTWHTYCFMQNVNITLNISPKILSVTLDTLRKISQTRWHNSG